MSNTDDGSDPTETDNGSDPSQESHSQDEEGIARRAIHVSGSVIPLSYVFGLVEWFPIRVFMLVAFLGAAVLEFIRLGIGYKFFNSLYREYESEYIAGYAIAATSIFIAVNVFKPGIAVVGILMLTACDPLAGILGSGELKRVKDPQILLAMFTACLVVGYLTTLSDTVNVSLLAITAGALGATVADGYKLRIKTYVIDDNLTIPLYSGVLMTGAEWLLSSGAV